MATIHKEFLNGGLVQTRHATLLRAGELQEATDTILRPGDPAIHKAPGRTVFGEVVYQSITVTTNGTTTLTSSAAFGTAITSVTTTADSNIVSKAAAFGAIVEGMTVVGSGVPANTYVRRVIDTSTLELTNALGGGSVTLTFCNIHPGTYISKADIPEGTYIGSIESASSLTMSAAATGSSAAAAFFSEAIHPRTLQFDGIQPDLLAAKAADKLYTAPLTAITGTFTELEQGLSHDEDSFLDSIQFANRHILLTGFDIPRTLLYAPDDDGEQTISLRSLGMLPVTKLVGAAVVSGSWSSLEDFQNGWYYFLVTEVAIFGTDDEIESTFEGDLASAQITDYTAQSITVTYTPAGNTPVNDGNYGRNLATHWRVYMSPRQADLSPAPDLAAFKRVAEVEISAASVTIGADNPKQSGYAQTLDAYSSDASLFPGGSTNALSAVAEQDRSSVLTAGNNSIVSSALFGTVAPGMYVTSPNDSLPFGTKVIAKITSSLIIVDKFPTTSGTETLHFSSSDSLDGAVARLPRNPGVTRRGGVFRDFGIGNIGGFSTGTITGVKVEITGSYLTDVGSDPGLMVALRKGASTYSVEKAARFSQRQQALNRTFGSGTIELGGQFDPWGLSWVPADFIDGSATFGVRVRKAFGVGDEINEHNIDGIRVTIYAGGDELTFDGEAFPAVTISDQLGNAFGTGANGPPPVASTGDVFDGALILNDREHTSSIVSSLPDEPDAFPDVYRLTFQSRNNDEVTLIRRLASVCVVGCQRSIKRLNYFPRETDPDFTQGRCYEDIATDHGIVGPKAATVLDLPGRGTILAYLSHSGLRWTDGVTSNFLNEDIDWENLIAPTLIHRSTLVVFPKLSILALYYVPLGGVRATKALYFSYHPLHIKEGFRLPAVGPIAVRTAGADTSVISGKEYLITGSSWDGYTYVEDSGTSDDSSGTITPAIRTRRFFASDVGKVGRVSRFLLLVDDDGNSTTGGLTITPYRQNQGQAVTAETAITEKDTATGGIVESFPELQAEMFDFAVSKSAAQSASLRLHYVAFEVTDYGEDTNN